VSFVYIQVMHVVEIENETPSLSSYVDIIKKVILLIGDKNLSTCKKAGQVLVVIGNEMRHILVATMFSKSSYTHVGIGLIN